MSTSGHLQAYSPSSNEPSSAFPLQSEPLTWPDLPVVCRGRRIDLEATKRLEAIHLTTPPEFPSRRRVPRWFHGVLRLWCKQR